MVTDTRTPAGLLLMAGTPAGPIVCPDAAADLLSALFARRDRGGKTVDTDLAMMTAEPTVADLERHFCVVQSAMILEGFLHLRRAGNVQPVNAECLAMGRHMSRVRDYGIR